MKNTQIKLLAQESFTRNILDKKRVREVSSKMTRANLRRYIKYLKLFEAKNSITIVVPNLKKINKNEINKFIKLYPNKNVKYKEDSSLILGIKIIDNDLISDFNLKNTFENIVSQI